MSEENELDLYQVLQVSPRASDEEVKQAYRSLARRFHPDCNPEDPKGSDHRIKLLNEAYYKLKTAEQRKHYNKMMGKRIRQRIANDNSENGRSALVVLKSFLKEVFWPATDKCNRGA